MRQQQITKRQIRQIPVEVDLRTPAGRSLPF
jgi:hypothetical protein